MVTWPRFTWKGAEPHTDLGIGSKEVRFGIGFLRVAVKCVQDSREFLHCRLQRKVFPCIPHKAEKNGIKMNE